jgi:hypothetical protein
MRRFMERDHAVFTLEKFRLLSSCIKGAFTMPWGPWILFCPSAGAASLRAASSAPHHDTIVAVTCIPVAKRPSQLLSTLTIQRLLGSPGYVRVEEVVGRDIHIHSCLSIIQCQR